MRLFLAGIGGSLLSSEQRRAASFALRRCGMSVPAHSLLSIYGHFGIELFSRSRRGVAGEARGG
jgi:hypothetical protein